MRSLNLARIIGAPVRFFVLASILFGGAGNRFVVAARAGALPGPSEGKSPSPSQIPAGALINPQDLARILSSPPSERPLIIYVGFRFPYTQAHIPGSEYFGPASNQADLQELLKRLNELSRDSFIVIYCGCCPWSHCPNIRPAYEALHNQGFRKLKVLYLAENLGTDWVNKGYPVAKGE